MKPLILDHFVEGEKMMDPFDIAWLMKEYDEVMDIYNLDIIEGWLYETAPD